MFLCLHEELQSMRLLPLYKTGGHELALYSVRSRVQFRLCERVCVVQEHVLLAGQNDSIMMVLLFGFWFFVVLFLHWNLRFINWARWDSVCAAVCLHSLNECLDVKCPPPFWQLHDSLFNVLIFFVFFLSFFQSVLRLVASHHFSKLWWYALLRFMAKVTFCHTFLVCMNVFVLINRMPMMITENYYKYSDCYENIYAIIVTVTFLRRLLYFNVKHVQTNKQKRGGKRNDWVNKLLTAVSALALCFHLSSGKPGSSSRESSEAKRGCLINC